MNNSEAEIFNNYRELAPTERRGSLVQNLPGGRRARALRTREKRRGHSDSSQMVTRSNVHPFASLIHRVWRNRT
jgi:hypothetical protein